MAGVGDIVDVDGRRVKIIEQVDTSRHDSQFQRRVKAMNGLFKAEEIVSKNTYMVYGIDIGYVP